ncbi:hypothetical protein RBH29_09415 [Herbivorax sp. ANBcel31]|uniref:hypothetical protein n=1 Tax=Herbivorax sp. ANBcel31 TaxID=3069754 RepID=UPI0027B6DA9B|nr:hypothetical protein [Herbivorax sp. ANBcel31]MDQ2086641.1 hypothetical protein [Herbivorax sp. ANBcel31]
MRSGLLRQFPEEIKEKIADNTIESYELRDVILKLIDKNPMFIIRAYLKTEDLRNILEEKDIEFIKNKLKSVITYEWIYFKFKKRIKEKMDIFIKDVAENFVRIILFEKKYEYNDKTDQIEEAGDYDINQYHELGDFLCEFEIALGNDIEDLKDTDNSSSFLSSIAENYIHVILKDLLMDIYEKRKKGFIDFFKLDKKLELSNRDFEELEYEVFEIFNTKFPILDRNNPVGAGEWLVSDALKMDVKLLYSLGKDIVSNNA